MPNESLLKDRPKVYSVEFWRFLFTIIVALYHLEIFYQIKLMPSGTTAVEFFFVLAGFTIAMSASRRVQNGGERDASSKEARTMAWVYLKKKLLAVYPILALTLIIAIVVIPLAFPATQMFSGASSGSFWQKLLERLGILASSEWEWLNLVGTPMGFNEASASAAPIVPLWFLTQLLLVGYIYTYFVNRKYDLMMFLAPVISVVGFTYFVLNSEKILDFYIQMGLFNAGTVRAITCMAMGITIYQVYEYVKGRDWKLFGKIVFQLLELFAIYRYVVLTINADISIDNFRRIPYILIIILLSFSNVTLLSKLLNRKFMEKLGNLSLTMYLIHFSVATVYWTWLFELKRAPRAWTLPGFIQSSGGMTIGYRPLPLSLGDLLMYIPFVIVVSVLINLMIKGIKTCLKKRRERTLS